MNSDDTFHATLTQRNEQNIVGGVEHLGQLPPQPLNFASGHPASEHRILNTMAVPFHVLRALTQPLLVPDVVTDEPPFSAAH